MLVLLLLLSACGRSSPTAPSLPAQAEHVNVPLTLAISGQSNAVLVQPFLRRLDPVVGFAISSVPIECWDVQNVCWRFLQQGLIDGTLTGDNEPVTAIADYQPSVVHAFVWWQGENDPANPAYRGELDDLVRRVRALTGQPNLLVVVVQLGATWAGQDGGAQGEAWARADANALFIETADLPFQRDATHMTDAGYAEVARRIDQRVRARLTVEIH